MSSSNAIWTHYGAIEDNQKVLQRILENQEKILALLSRWPGRVDS